MPKTKKKMSSCCEAAIKKAKKMGKSEVVCTCRNSFSKDSEGEWILVYSGERTNGGIHG